MLGVGLRFVSRLTPDSSTHTGTLLTGDDLSTALRDIIAGRDLRGVMLFRTPSAVAPREIGQDLDQIRIVRDPSTGECPRALLELGSAVWRTSTAAGSSSRRG